MSVDSAWLQHCDSERGLGRHVNLIAGRATFTDSPPKYYAYVRKVRAPDEIALPNFCTLSKSAAPLGSHLVDRG